MIKKDFDQALSYYTRAIEVARKINNKLVLGESLVEKGEALIAAERMEDAQVIHHEAIKIANALGNPDLVFKSKIFSSKLAFAMNETAASEQILQNLMTEFTSGFEQASIYFWLFHITQQDQYKIQSLERYKKLYAETPLYLFEERIKELTPK